MPELALFGAQTLRCPQYILVKILKQFWPHLDDAETVQAVSDLSAQGKFGDEIADTLGLGIEQVIMIRIRHGIEPAGGSRPWSRIPVQKRDAIARLTDVPEVERRSLYPRTRLPPLMIARHRASYKLPTARQTGLGRSTVYREIQNCPNA